MKKIALFDFDGVIINTFDMAYKIMKLDEDFTEDEFRTMFAGNIYDSIDELVAKRNFPTDEEYYAVYSPAILDMEPMPGIRELFKQLFEKNIQIFIVSSSASEPLKNYFEKFQLDQFITEILGGDLERSKIKKFKMIVDKTDVEFKDMVFITDTLGDLIEAHEVGIDGVGVTYGYHPEEFLKKAPGKVVLAHGVDEVTQAILLGA